MDLKNQMKKIKKLPLLAISIVFVLVVCASFILIGQHNSTQSSSPTVAGLTFQGEYKIGDGEWRTLDGAGHIPSTKGDVTLRGTFVILDPVNGEPIGNTSEGMNVSLYFNHISGEIYTPTGERILLDAENEFFGEDACAEMWGGYTTAPPNPETGSEEITIVLRNPHKYGNENAVDDFLENMTLAPGFYLEKTMLEVSSSDRTVGLLVIISSFIILGIAFFSSLIHIKNSREMWFVGLMSLFAGGYFIFDSFSISLWNSPYIVNTRALVICIMLYSFFLSAILVFFVARQLKRVAIGASCISALSALICVFVSFFTDVYFFDTLAYWTISQVLVSITLIVCLICSFRGSTPMNKLLCFFGIISLSSFLTDALATKFGWWEGGFLSKLVFLVLFIVSLVIVLRVIPSHINAAIKAKKLEDERQALKLELQESRISIMLSQMQPHFIYNTLNTIYHLCEIDPDAARRTISSFSEYLRNNIDTLGQSDMISFEKEISFVKTYLDIEKVRFEDELEISFDIQATNFKLPVLSVQPIVENAVKHGTSKKEGVSHLSISTRETDTCYEIIVSDTGVGFNSTVYANDGHKHIGISSVKQRLENLCDGSLSIESTLGVGTKATITIPKKEVPTV